MGLPSERPSAEAFLHSGTRPAIGRDARIRYQYETDRMITAVWQNVGIVIWGRQATQALVEKLEERTRADLDEFPQGISAIHIVLDGTPLPDADARVGLAELSQRYGPRYGSVLTVIEGDGFWRSAMRSFVTGLHWVGRRPFHAKICSTLEEAAQALPDPHRKRTGVAVNSADLLSALREVRDRVAR